MTAITIGKATAETALRKEAEKVLDAARDHAERLAKIEGQVTRRGFWLDHMKNDAHWYDARAQWERALAQRERALVEIAALARTADYYADQLHDETVSSVAVHVLVRQIAPPIGLFCRTSDLAYGEPDQYAPLGWRPKEITHESE